MGMEAVMHGEMCLGHVKISKEEIAPTVESVCEPIDSSVTPLGI
jgi:hypothetical protein